MDTKFTDLGLRSELIAGIERLGYESPSPIQAETIPVALEGHDIVGLSQTGSGKTAAFGLPALNLIDINRDETQVLMLCPTRELAVQVCEEIHRLASALKGLVAVPVYGGAPLDRQMRALRKGAHVVVGTPGRVMDHLRRKTLRTDAIRLCVLDEADRMLDMGFIRDIRKLLNIIPKQRQTLLFSATFSKEIRNLASEFLKQPAQIQVTPENTAVELVSQIVYPVDKKRKRELLSHKIGEEEWQQVLVFTRTKHSANKLTEQLGDDGITSAAIHGNKSQGARTKALADFKAGNIRVLVATDIAARGIDIEKLPHVVNFELPNVPEDYVHRIGRTARAGQKGHAISLVCVDELKLLRDIEKVLGLEIEKINLPGYDVDPLIKAEAIRNGGGRSGGGRNGGGRSGDGRNNPGNRGNHGGKARGNSRAASGRR